MIPRRIFFYWGNSTMSWMRYMTLYSFRKFNPDWSMTLYYNDNNLTEKTWKDHNEQDYYSFTGVDYMDRLKALKIKLVKWELKGQQMGSSHISNLLKWSKLHETGGIYSDLDILYFRPIDKFYCKIKEFDAAICETEHLSIGLLASRRGSPFFKDIHKRAMKGVDLETYQSAGVMCVYEVYNSGINIIGKARDKYPGHTIFNIPMNIVYNFKWNEVQRCIKNAYGVNDFPPEAIGYHWYAGDPDIQKYNNLLNEDNFREHDITFTKLANEILSD